MEYDKNGNLLYGKWGNDAYQKNVYDVAGKLRKKMEGRSPHAIPFAGRTNITEYEYDHEGRKVTQEEKTV